MKNLELLERVLVIVAVLALVAIMLLTTISVIGYYLFWLPIPDNLVMIEFLMVVVVFLPFSDLQAAREHAFVTFFTNWLSNKSKVVMDTIGVVLGFGIFSIISMAVFTDFHSAWEVGAYANGSLELPESPPRFIVFFGLAVFSLRLLVDAITSIFGLFSGRAVASFSEKTRALDADFER